MGLNLGIVFDNDRLKTPPDGMPHDASSRDLLHNMEDLDRLAVAHKLKPLGRWVGDGERTRWMSARVGLETLEGLLKILTEEPAKWRAVCKPRPSDSDIDSLISDIKAFRTYLKRGAAKNAKFYFIAC